MKKVTILLLALLTLFVFSSCYSEPSSLSMVAFTVNNQSRSLEDSFNDLDGMVWRYTALKTDNTVDQTGKEVSPILVGKEGKITSEVGPFSQGNWTFTLYGARTKEESNAGQYAYIGISEVTIKDSKCNVNVKVSPQITDGGIGTLVINKDIKLLDVLNQNIKDGTYDVLIDVKKSDTVSFDTPELKDGVYTYANIPSGAYSVNIKYVAKTNHDVVFGEDTIYSIVFDNLTTTISGSLNAPSETQFVPDADGSIVASTKVQVSATEETEVKVASSPVNPYGKEEGSTTAISFPSGSFTEDKNVVLNIKSYTTSEAGEKFEVTDESTVIAGLAINMTDENGTAITEFNENAATVTTYIAKGLTFENISVVYNGLGDAPEKVSYDSITGKLVFRTTHFSEFYITTIDNIEAVNTTTNTAYGSLYDALDNAKADDAIVMLKDFEYAAKDQLLDDSALAIKVPCTLDGNGHKILNNLDDVLSNSQLLNIYNVKNGDVIIQNLAVYSKSSGRYLRGINLYSNENMSVTLRNVDVDIPDYYAINIIADNNHVSLNLEKGCQIKGWSTIYNKSSNLNLVAKDCVFDSFNKYSGDYNGFSSIIVAEYYDVDESGLNLSYGNEMIFSDCVFSAKKDNSDVSQFVFDLRCPNHNVLKLSDCTFTEVVEPFNFQNAIDTAYCKDSEERENIKNTNKIFLDGKDITNDETLVLSYLDE